MLLIIQDVNGLLLIEVEIFKITIKHVGVMTRENKTPKIANLILC